MPGGLPMQTPIGTIYSTNITPDKTGIGEYSFEQELAPGAAIFLSADNVFGHTVEAGRSADGLVTIGMPRVVSAGLRLRI